jgi:2-C-methyl-D-erythritol 2,4-cyclodiphosphate synthase
MRIGYGYDAHRLKAGRKLILCGVEIPCDFGPDGHSDADVATHALIDAILGALALGDIGNWFPDSENKWQMADSVELLKIVNNSILEKGYSIGNADITIVLQSPYLSQYIQKMRSVLADALKTEISNISIKATTEENMGFTGDGTGISASAVVIIKN